MSEGHKHPNYMAIFGVLCVLTAIELILAMKLQEYKIALIIVLVTLALIKAGLVAAYFMHLKFEKKAFAVIVCLPLLLAVVLICGLGPDVAWMHDGKNHALASPSQEAAPAGGHEAGQPAEQK